MVGKPVSPSQNSSSLTLEGLIPKDNFYRRLKQILDLTFLYAAVEPYYGKCGQHSVDPVVFFKLLLVGHFENLTSNRSIIRKSQLRLDVLYFLDYSVGQPLPWHGVPRTAPFPALASGYLQRCSKLVFNGSWHLARR